MRLLVALSFLVAGCQAAAPLVDVAPVSSDGLTLTADKDAYARGETARLDLRNGGTATATTGVLECAHIERWTGAAWERSAEGNDRACIMIARILQPGESMTGAVPLDVPAGAYRLTQGVSVEGSETGVSVSTGSFRVGG
ncbi:MAG TPA: immunoglobulin-like domain-containing protein [Rubricoccaceae bacterium]|jgi:hypothetical protein